MELTTLIGILAGLAAIVGGFLLEGGQLSGLFKLTAALIVFGGTFAAVAVSYPLARLRLIPQALRYAFTKHELEQDEIIDEMIRYATVSRRHGLLVLEKRLNNHTNDFLREGMFLAIDGADPEQIRDTLELEIDALERKHEQYARIFESAGGYAPTMGIIGTVVGLIHVLSQLSDPSALGPSIAVAFTATLYGVLSANLIYLPIASKIQTRCQEECQHLELIMHGILSIRAGDQADVIRKKLRSLRIETDDVSFSLFQRKEQAVPHETE